MATSYLDHKAQRDVIVDLIYKKRRILFGRKADMQAKGWAWEEISMEAKKLGVYPEERDYMFLRDVRWQNWRKRVISKYKRHKIKGTKSPDFDERDEQIFEIMQDFFPNHLQKVDRAVNFDDSDDTAMDDEDSVVHGIEFSDVGEDPIKVVNVKKDGDVTEYGDSDNDETVAPADFDKAPDVAGENVTSAQNNGAFHANTFQNRRMDALKVEMAEMQNYKMKLELMKMERELYLKPSKYTKDIMSRQGLYQRRKITPITKSSASHR